MCVDYQTPISEQDIPVGSYKTQDSGFYAPKASLSSSRNPTTPGQIYTIDKTKQSISYVGFIILKLYKEHVCMSLKTQVKCKELKKKYKRNLRHETKKKIHPVN